MDPGRRGDLDTEAARLLVTRVRSCAGDDGAGDQGQRRERGDADGVAADLGRHRPHRLAFVGLGGMVDEHHGVGDEHQRDDHVPLDGERVEVDEHGDPAEHDLGENAGDEAERQPGQIPPPGDADQRTEHGGDHGDADETGEQAVELLDRGVARRDIDELGAAARRPVGTPQP